MKTVYALRDPRTGDTAFVGASKNPQALFWLAVSQAKDGKSGKKSEWIRTLLLDDVKPYLHIIEESPDELAQAKVEFWRGAFKQLDVAAARTYPPKSPSEARKSPLRAASLRTQTTPSRRRETRDTQRIQIQLKLHRQRPPQGIGSTQESKLNSRPDNEKEPI